MEAEGLLLGPEWGATRLDGLERLGPVEDRLEDRLEERFGAEGLGLGR